MRRAPFIVLTILIPVMIASHAEHAEAQTFTAFRDIAYVSGGSTAQRLDIYVPDGASAPVPLIIWIHGGGWQSGDKALGQNSFQLSFARSGYAVASLNYRLSGEAIFPAQIHDCKAAIRWLRANAAQYNIDPLRFAVWGSSAGGHLAALVGTSANVADIEGTVGGNTEYSSRVQAVVDWYGPTGFLQMDTQAVAQGCGASNHNSANSPESLLLGCQIQGCPNAAARANPMTYVSSDDPPFFIQHGTSDCTVPTGQSAILNSLLTNAGESPMYLPLTGAGHGGAQFSAPANIALVSDFIAQNVRDRPPDPATIAGRVLTPDGRGVRNARILLNGPQGLTAEATSSSFGAFAFAEMPPGHIYTLTVLSKRYRYVPKAIQAVGFNDSAQFLGLD